MRNDFGLLFLACALTAVPAGLAIAASGPSSGTTGGDPDGTVTSEFHNATAAAKASYNTGLRLIRKARAYDAEASKASAAETRANAHDKAQSTYKESIPPLIDTVIALPKLYQAWGNLGFANLQLGRYEDSLAAYSKALEINPDFPDAIAGRGQASLGLNLIDDAKSAYGRLGNSPKSAEELMTAMLRWVAAHHEGAQDLPRGEVDAFTKWLDERAVNTPQVN
ncbi:MAG TPA: tetratricopeptide repeat protein [Steroidobacteraceae bacterium]|jgi:tetratricopeptide (TPR) repeat protein